MTRNGRVAFNQPARSYNVYLLTSFFNKRQLQASLSTAFATYFLPTPFILMTATASQWILRDAQGYFIPISHHCQASNRSNIWYETKPNLSKQQLAFIISSSVDKCSPKEHSIVYVPPLVAEVFESKEIHPAGRLLQIALKLREFQPAIRKVNRPSLF